MAEQKQWTSPPAEQWSSPPPQNGHAPYQQQQYQQQQQFQQHPQHNGQQQQQYYQQQPKMQAQPPTGPPSEWETGLCSIGGCENCVLGCCLPCVLVGRTSERMRDPSMQSYDSMNNDCLIMTGINCLTGCGWIWAMMKRGEIREQFNIKGSGCGDCCVSFWCSCCAVIQQEKEVKRRLEKGTITQAYSAPQGGMHMPAPGQQH